MPVQLRPRGRLRVIAVPHPHRSRPTVARDQLHRLVYPSADHHVVPRHMAVARVQTHPYRRARPQPLHQLRHLLKLPPSENSAPAVFSISTRKSQSSSAIPSIARSIPSAASCRPSSRVSPFHDPGCSTRYSAPSASARSTSPRNAVTDFSRKERRLAAQVHQIARVDHQWKAVVLLPQLPHLLAVAGLQLLRLPHPRA